MTSRSVIDLRSDTVTRPGPDMRRAMAQADVADDVYGEDPTINRLQQQVAEIVGTEAALFVPSGTMANQIAIRLHTQPGDEMLVGQAAHNWLYETGAAPALSGVQVTRLPGDGRFDAAALCAEYKPDSPHTPVTTLVSVENTHNMGGGVVWDNDALAAVLAEARALGLKTHLDGARLWNAAVATGRTEKELCAGFDTVSVCLSKGLGAPVGSLLCGSRELMHRGHRVRKMYGGGMRQAGILAAAGLYALEHHRARLAEDHENAKLLARALSEVPELFVDLDRVHTNIVIVHVAAEAQGRLTATELAQKARERGVVFSALSATRLRLVTHLDVSRDSCARAAEIISDIARAGSA